jgi:hypothetical protein
MTYFNVDGSPKHLACYEAKRGGVVDRFTIVFTYAHLFMGENWKGRVFYVSASENPTGIYGYCLHDSVERERFCPCGSRVKWFALPESLREWVLNEYCELWEIDRTGERKHV